MVRIAISVEGTTEERFIQMVLAPYLAERNLYVFAINLQGNINVQRVASELTKLSYNFDRVTTLYDFYGFKNLTQADTKKSLEEKIINHINSSVKDKIYPYIQMYEFEAILFSSPSIISQHLSGDNVLSWATNILMNFSDNPEKINNSVITAPSKRFQNHTNYMKVIHGPKIAKEIGLDQLRQKCQGFNDWITMMENW